MRRRRPKARRSPGRADASVPDQVPGRTHGGSGYAPVGTGHFHCAVAKRLMVQFGHEITSQSPIPRAVSWQQPTEHRIVMEGAGEHLSGLRRISTPGRPYLKTATHASVGRYRIPRLACETKDRLPGSCCLGLLCGLSADRPGPAGPGWDGP